MSDSPEHSTGPEPSTDEVPGSSGDDDRISGSGLTAERFTGFYVSVLVLLVLMVELTGFAYTMVTPALTGISAEFHAPGIGWVMTAVTLVGAVSYAVFGKAGDVLGKKKIAAGATGVFAVGSALAALAPNLPVMITGRALQGAGICTVALVYGLIRDLFPRRLVPLALGFVGAGFGMSSVLGPLIGGALIDSSGFRSVFWFLTGYSALVAILVWVAVPETPLRHRVRMDWTGILILGAGAVAFMLGVGNAGDAGWSAPLSLLGILGGIGLLVLWLRYERRPAEPLIDPGLLKQRRVAGTMVASFVVQFALGGSTMLVPLFVMAPSASGYGFGVGALGAAKFTVVSGIAGVIAGPIAGAASRRVDPSVTLSCGILALTVGALSLGLLHSNGPQVVVGQLVLGIGVGTCSASLPNMIVTSVPATVQGISGGMMTLTGSLGSAFSTQLMMVLLLVPATSTIAGKIVYGESGFSFAFLAIAGLGVIGLLAMAYANARRDRPEAVADTASEVRSPSA